MSISNLWMIFTYIYLWTVYTYTQNIIHSQSIVHAMKERFYSCVWEFIVYWYVCGFPIPTKTVAVCISYKYSFGYFYTGVYWKCIYRMIPKQTSAFSSSIFISLLVCALQSLNVLTVTQKKENNHSVIWNMCWLHYSIEYTGFSSWCDRCGYCSICVTLHWKRWQTFILRKEKKLVSLQTQPNTTEPQYYSERSVTSLIGNRIFFLWTFLFLCCVWINFVRGCLNKNCNF